MDHQFLEQQLSKKNIRPTAVRLRVLNQFSSDPVAVSLNELEEELKPVDRSTLFRTLKTFEKSGIIHTVNEENGTVKYALCAESCNCSYTDHLHVHFSCNTCLKTFCLHDIHIPDVDLPDGFVPVDANVVIKGICKSCSG
ncbi:MAG: Fur family transcriptional regulator [Balneolaceae bacterium]